jgi:hypothetical protein
MISFRYFNFFINYNTLIYVGFFINKKKKKEEEEEEENGKAKWG